MPAMRTKPARPATRNAPVIVLCIVRSLRLISCSRFHAGRCASSSIAGIAARLVYHDTERFAQSLKCWVASPSAGEAVGLVSVPGILHRSAPGYWIWHWTVATIQVTAVHPGKGKLGGQQRRGAGAWRGQGCRYVRQRRECDRSGGGPPPRSMRTDACSFLHRETRSARPAVIRLDFCLPKREPSWAGTNKSLSRNEVPGLLMLHAGERPKVGEALAAVVAGEDDARRQLEIPAEPERPRPLDSRRAPRSGIRRSAAALLLFNALD